MKKSEYWTLILDAVLLVVTGLILWFDNIFIGLSTNFGKGATRIIHLYEAWLALLAILVWRIYFVIFNPGMYPMNLYQLKGTITKAEMADKHRRIAMHRMKD